MFKTLYKKLKALEHRLGAFDDGDITVPTARRRAYMHFYLIDHGILRSFWTNLHEISPGVWRSNQPSQKRLRDYKNMGIATVLNLRGKNTNSPYLFEKETCDAIGLGLVSIGLSARSLASRDTLLFLLDEFDSIKRPFVMHCKSGADRAGLASALYLLHMENQSIAQARKQLSFRFLHIKSSKTGILDHMLNAYESDTINDPMSIRSWISTRYDSVILAAEFNAKRGQT